MYCGFRRRAKGSGAASEAAMKEREEFATEEVARRVEEGAGMIVWKLVRGFKLMNLIELELENATKGGDRVSVCQKINHWCSLSRLLTAELAALLTVARFPKVASHSCGHESYTFLSLFKHPPTLRTFFNNVRCLIY